MRAADVNMGYMDISRQKQSIALGKHQLAGRTFLLGNRAGFALYLPAARNVRDATAQSIKWFGAGGFDRTFYEGSKLLVEINDRLVSLDRECQVGFEMHLGYATRIYQIDGVDVRETYFVPDGIEAVVLTLEGPMAFRVQPEFDMRFYQSFNDDFTQYRAETEDGKLLVSNRVQDRATLHEVLEFYATVGADSEQTRIEMRKEDQRLVRKVFLKDEMREKMIERVYKETQARAPDEAPIWDKYSTQVYAPAVIYAQSPVRLVSAYGDTRDEADRGFSGLLHDADEYSIHKRRVIEDMLVSGNVETGDEQVDVAYMHVLTRFNDALVARDATMHIAPVHREHFYGIFAGNKYFLDAWKRDENISLGALLVTGDFETARAILDNTWQFQDERTGRLPHIIRAGEPLVYYSSDGTLWALRRLWDYTVRSGDTTLLESKLPMVQHFFRASKEFVAQGLLPSGGIIDSSYLWETWEDTPYTPRDGYPVEIELLWLTALDNWLPWVADRDTDLGQWMESTLARGKQSFDLFRGDGYLFDSLNYQLEPRRELTPNAWVAFALDYVLPIDLVKSMVLLARDQLAGRRGVRSLAPRDWAAVFPHDFLADPANVQGKNMRSVGIFNYHRGIEWEWLNPFFVRAELLAGNSEAALEHYVLGQVREALGEVGIGGLSELQDMHGQVGADFQAWSMAGFVESLHEFAGVRVDALQRRVVVAPALPHRWNRITVRSRIGETWFDVTYAATSDGAHRLEVEPRTAIGDHVLEILLQLRRAGVIRSTRVNGGPTDGVHWTYEASATGSKARATLPFSGPLTLEVHE